MYTHIPSQTDLNNRTVLITGASGGLGERFARICATAGAKVILTARRIDRLTHIADDIRQSGGEALALAMDVADEQSIRKAFAAAEAQMGPINSVIVNAGIELSRPVDTITAEDFDKVMAVNVRGAFITAQEAARRMHAVGIAEDGRIVLISSITARTTTPGILTYSVSKAAVSHMGRLLAREWVRTGPNVNCIAPGYIESEMNRDWFETENGQKQISRFPRRRLVPEDSLDRAILYLLSDAARGTTGAEIVIDDGQTL